MGQPLRHTIWTSLCQGDKPFDCNFLAPIRFRILGPCETAFLIVESQAPDGLGDGCKVPGGQPFSRQYLEADQLEREPSILNIERVQNSGDVTFPGIHQRARQAVIVPLVGLVPRRGFRDHVINASCSGCARNAETQVRTNSMAGIEQVVQRTAPIRWKPAGWNCLHRAPVLLRGYRLQCTHSWLSNDSGSGAGVTRIMASLRRLQRMHSIAPRTGRCRATHCASVREQPSPSPVAASPDPSGEATRARRERPAPPRGCGQWQDRMPRS